MKGNFQVRLCLNAMVKTPLREKPVAILKLQITMNNRLF